jgi:hypothetical protein
MIIRVAPAAVLALGFVAAPLVADANQVRTRPTSRCNGPRLAMLAPAAERGRHAYMREGI